MTPALTHADPDAVQRPARPGSGLPRHLRTVAGVVVLSALLTVSRAAAADNADETRIVVREPVPYGYQIGDLLVREVTVYPAPGSELAPRSLPKLGRANTWFSLRAIDTMSVPGGGSRLRLEYQVANVPEAVRTVSLPEFAVPLQNGTKVVRLAVNPSYVTVAPMTPGTVLGKDRLVEIQADAEAIAVDTGAATSRSRDTMLFALVPLLALAYCWTPWERLLRPRRPFARALREAQRLRSADDAAFWQGALKAMHQALDATAGRTVFPGETRVLVERHAGYARLEADLAGWLDVSRGLFFGNGTWPARSRRSELLRLLGEARSVERGIQ